MSVPYSLQTCIGAFIFALGVASWTWFLRNAFRGRIGRARLYTRYHPIAWAAWNSFLLLLGLSITEAGAKVPLGTGTIIGIVAGAYISRGGGSIRGREDATSSVGGVNYFDPQHRTKLEEHARDIVEAFSQICFGLPEESCFVKNHLEKSHIESFYEKYGFSYREFEACEELLFYAVGSIAIKKYLKIEDTELKIGIMGILGDPKTFTSKVTFDQDVHRNYYGGFDFLIGVTTQWIIDQADISKDVQELSKSIAADFMHISTEQLFNTDSDDLDEYDHNARDILSRNINDHLRTLQPEVERLRLELNL